MSQAELTSEVRVRFTLTQVVGLVGGSISAVATILAFVYLMIQYTAPWSAERELVLSAIETNQKAIRYNITMTMDHLQVEHGKQVYVPPLVLPSPRVRLK